MIGASGRAVRARAGAAAALLALLPLLVGAAACGAGGDGSGRGGGARGAGASGFHGAVLPEARPGGDFTLTATDGEPYEFARETEGRVTLLFFGYTHCPNACPVQMATLGAAYGKLPFELQDRIEVVFVTTDPARDTLPRLRNWLDHFHESFVGLRGRREEVNRIMESYGLPPARIDSSSAGPGNPGEGYTVGHATHVLVFTPDGRLRMMYPTGTRQEAWVEDLRRLAREGASALPEAETAAGREEPGAAGGPGPGGG